MKINKHISLRIALFMTLIVGLALLSARMRADTGACGGANITLPFTDVPGSNSFFCQIAGAYFSALTNGTTATTYSPSANVTREQMAAFVTRTMDQSLRRGSSRAALNQLRTPTSPIGLGLTTVGTSPQLVESDGADLWVASKTSGAVSRVRASDGKLLQTWIRADAAVGVLAVKGQIFITGQTIPGSLYQIDPTLPAGSVTTVTTSLGDSPRGLAYDGERIWTADSGGSVSIVTLDPLQIDIITGFINPEGILYDGANIWVTDFGGGPVGKLFKLDSNGAIIQTVDVGELPRFPVFDGTNIWVPDFNSNTVTVVRASTGLVLATLTDNGLNGPFAAAFDGERILVTNNNGDSISLWKATDLSPLGVVDIGSSSIPVGVCSDGLNFWITLSGPKKLARF